MVDIKHHKTVQHQPNKSEAIISQHNLNGASEDLEVS